jgi:dTDP-glucose pyrophosphorylase/CBS domain-containing protein
VDFKKFLISPGDSIREAMACIDRNARGIALVVDGERRLIATVTDGDVRRAVLAGVDLNLPVLELIKRRKKEPHPTPLSARTGTPAAELIRMMNEFTLSHIPLLDDEERVVDMVLLRDMVKEYEMPLRAVVMAGGFGTRLRPLTEALPKPMLPVGNKPLLEHIIEQLRQVGIRRVNLTTHYKSELISEHFGDGRNFGVEIEYVKEDKPLGTVGALSLLNPSEEPLLVINGDILTRIDFHAMLDFHREQKANMTVAVREVEFRVPYGVVETEGVEVTRISEKPVLRHFINAGIYLLNPEVCHFIPNDRPYDMPELINRLVGAGRKVISFPVREYWLDIGKIEDYQQALADLDDGGLKR